MNFFKFHIGDYLRDTGHLTTLQHGVYLKLLLRYYSTGGPLTADLGELARVCRIVGRWEKEALEVVVREFFVEAPDGLRQLRCDRDVSAYSLRSAQSTSAAEKRWQNKDDTMPSASKPQCQPEPEPEPLKKERAQAPRPRFARPALEEVKAYCTERKNTIDPQKFIDYYDSKGWVIGKSPMKDWKAAIRTWERTSLTSQPSPTPNPAARVCGVCGDASGSGVHSQRGWRCMRHMGD